MIKRLVPAVVAIGLSAAAASPAAASADCGLAGLLSSCTPAPVSQPVPTPVLPAVDPAIAPTPAPVPSAPVAPPAPAPAPPALVPAVTTSGVPLPAAASRLLQLVNEERVAAGLAALASDGRLGSIAAGHSAAMAARGDIWHNDAYFTAATRRAVGARALGENVAMNGNVEAAHRRLMASAGHRANILNGAFDAVGIAVVQDAGGTYYLTQDFADLVSGPAAATAAPKPAPAKASPAPKARTAKPAVTLKVASVPAEATPAPAPATPAGVATAPADAVLAAGATAGPGGSPLRVAAFALGLLTAVGAVVARAAAAAFRAW